MYVKIRNQGCTVHYTLTNDAISVVREMKTKRKRNTADGIARRLNWKVGEHSPRYDNHRAIRALRLLQRCGLVQENMTAAGSKWDIGNDVATIQFEQQEKGLQQELHNNNEVY